MNKKIFIFLIVLVILGIGIFAWQYSSRVSDKKFLSQLKGEIVFARRDNGVLNIYKINANGTGEKLLYHNGNFPEWSKDRTKIYFTAFKKGKLMTFAMDENGGNIKVVSNKNIHLLNHPELEKDIVIQKGSVYWKDDQGNFHQVYHFSNQNYKLNPGASEASWSPDKKYIIFQSCSFLSCKIMIAKKDGSKVVGLTKGIEPDWKY